MRISRFIVIVVFFLNSYSFCYGQSFDPEIISVSVDTLNPVNQGRVKISWEPINHPDVIELEIYRYNSQGFPNRIAIVEKNQVEYTDGLALADQMSKGYTMASITNNNSQSPTLVDPHFTIYLQAFDFDYCNKSIQLTWNHYVGWGSSLNAYEIYRKKGTADYEHVTSLSADDSVFTENNVDFNTIYKYYVLAKNNTGAESISNIVQVITDPEQDLDLTDFYLDSVSYDGSKVLIGFNGIQSELIGQYAVYFKDNVNARYEHLFDIQNTLAERYFVQDHNPGNNGRYYTIQAYGQCDDLLGQTNIIRQVVLEGQVNENRVTLSWGDGFDEVDQFFEVMVQKDGGNFQIQEQVNLNKLVQYDLLELSNGSSENFCFYIAAKLPNGYYSKSNTLCFSIKPVVTLPNAFTPNGDGLNDYIKPEIEYADIKDYEFFVYDKYGGRIFETTNPNYKWNGKRENKNVKEGGYLYYLNFTTRWGNSYEQSGVINVLYP